MSRCYTRTKAFNSYGLKLKNPRYSLSALCEKQRKVGVSIWQDECRVTEGRIIYERASWGDWHDGPGRRELFRNLQWALDHRNGFVQVVICIRKRTDEGYVMTDSFARPGLIMRIRHLDSSTGAFTLEQIFPDKQVA